MKVETNGIIKSSVIIDIKETLIEVKKCLEFCDEYAEDYSLCEHDGVYGIYSIWDSSYHGSPTWEYRLISKDEKDIEAFRCINYLIEFFRERDINGF